MIFAGFGVVWGLCWILLLKKWSVPVATVTGLGAIWTVFWLLVGLAILGGLAYAVYWLVARLWDASRGQR